MSSTNKKLNLSSLIILILSSMLGAGVFSLPQNLAETASPFALILVWIITAIGIIFFSFSLLLLSRLRPDLDCGVYTYAKEGFGEFIGFCSALGYWLSTIVANIACLVIIFSSFNFFIDNKYILFQSGNTWQSLVGESVLLWLVHFLLLKGVYISEFISKITIFTKLFPLIIFIIYGVFFFDTEIFKLDFYGFAMHIPIWQQVHHSILITLWVFIGIEGAVILSAHAKKRNDIGLSTTLAIFFSLIIYILITIISYGIMPQEDIVKISNPSMIGLMNIMLGNYGKIIIFIGLISSVITSYLNWTIMAAEIPHIFFLHNNLIGTSKIIEKYFNFSSCLWCTNIVMQFILIIICIFKINYNLLLIVASEMILIPYFLIAMFLIKISFNYHDKKILIIGLTTSFYMLLLITAAKIKIFLLLFIFYITFITIKKIFNNNISIK